MICQPLLLQTYGIKLNVCGTHAVSINLSHFVAVFYLFKHKVNNWFTLRYSPINLKLHTLPYCTFTSYEFHLKSKLSNTSQKSPHINASYGA